MRIGIDARFYGPSAGTGIGRYTNRLIEQLEALDDENEYVIFLRHENFGFYTPTNPRFSKVRAPWRWYSLGEQVGFPKLLRSHRLDLVHFLNFNVPLFSPQPFVVTIHDLILSKFPTARASTLEPAFYWLKQTAYNLVIRTAIRRSRAIIAVTESTKRDVVSGFGVSPRKITVTYEACDAAQPLPLARRDFVERELGVRGPFLLNVGTAYPHKNLERLVDVVGMLRERGLKISLVLVGREDYFLQRLKRLVADRRLNEHQPVVVFTGYVHDDVLDLLYRKAKLYVCSSFYEGFGLSGLEAMARGLPVAASNTSSLPEVYGDAAEYFNPNSAPEMANVIERLLHDEPRLRELRERGQERVKRFSWRRMAEETLAVYTSVGRRHEL